MGKAFKSVLILLFNFFLFHNLIQGQSLSIKIKDNERKAMVGATIQLVNLSDSVTLYKTTDIKGVALFDNIENGLYFLKVSYVGFETIEKTISVKPDKRYFDYQLKESTVSLDEVTITAKRPLITQEDDKMIIDPEPMASISSNTLEVLESTPGMYVDQDGGIFLNSATPAAIYINGREQKMSSQDITTLLRNLPPGSVQRIEVLRTPSTKYDAASSGGIINIVLKKGVKLGQFGTLSGGFNQGKYGNRFGTISFNTGKDKTTSYINLSYNYHDRFEEINSLRFLNNDTVINQSALSRPISHKINTAYGISYDVTDNTIFSYDGRISYNKRLTNSENNNIVMAFDSIKLMESDNYIDGNFNQWHIQQDFGLLKKIDTLGSEWDTKFGYGLNLNDARQDYSTEYIFPLSFNVPSKGNDSQERHFFLLQSDLTYHLPYKFKIETGFKSTFQYYISDAKFYNIQNGEQLKDSMRTNSYNFQERITGLYLQVSRELWGGFLLKSGLRMEDTYMKGNQIIPTDTSFLVNRADWFPYVYLSRPFSIIFDIDLQLYIIYRKTINRPDYQNLNPSVRYIDQFLYESGNPELKPQFADNVEFNLSYDDTPLFAIGQNYIRDIFSNVTYKDKNNPNIGVRTYDNLGKSKETYFRGIVGIPPGRKYFFAIGAQYNLNEFEGFYDNQPFTYERGSWRFFTFHSLKLFENTRLRMSGFMMENGSWNFYELKTFGQFNFGISQDLFDKKLNISFSARDIFRTMKNEFTLNVGSLYATGTRYFDAQRFGINIRYNFGIKDKAEKKEFMRENGEE